MRSCRLYQCSSKDKNTEEVIKPKESFNRRSCEYRNSLCAVRCECCAHRRPRRTSSRIMHKQKHLEVNGSDIETKRKKFRMAVKAPRSKNISRTNNQIETKGCNESCTSGTITMTPTPVSVEVVVATSPNNSHNFYPSEQDNAKTLSGQRTTRLRRRRRKFTTMKRNRRKTFSDSIKGTSIRQPSPLPLMNAEELVAESGGILTLEAVEDFSAVQMRVTNEIKSLQSQSCQIETVVLGNQFEIKPWYRGNYPAEYATLTKLHVCDGCFMYFRLEEVCLKHMRKCPLRGAPPGHEIYRDTHNNMSVFEVNGEKMPNYCANLCRLTMMWLGDKVVFADVEPFFFYILANSSEGFFKTLGYFSKGAYLNYI